MDFKTVTDEIERVSKAYAAKFEIERDSDWFILKLQEELGELIQSYLMATGQARKKGLSDQELTDNLQSEVADVFCHVLLLAKHFDIDLEKVVSDKWLVWNSAE